MIEKNDIAFRVFSILILLTVSCIALIASFGNITDPESNMQFVRHIFSMDTTYQSPRLMWRAINAPWIHWAGMITILTIEAIAGIVGLFGVYKLVKHIKADEATFNQYKTCGFITFALAVVIWGFIFQAGGGEWFASWQSSVWNGIRDATRIVLMAIGGGISLRLAK